MVPTLGGGTQDTDFNKGFTKGHFTNFRPNSSDRFRALKLTFFAFPVGPEGFRELREAGRNHVHLSWYLLVPGITSYDQKPSAKGILIFFSGMFFLNKLCLDEGVTSWDLKNRIPRRKEPI